MGWDRRALLIGGGAAIAALAGAARGQVAAPTSAAPAAAPVTPVVPVSPPPELEPVRAITVTRRGLTIRVASRGCTRKADFVFFVERRAGVTTLAFGRKRLDTCRRPRAAEASLSFSFKELGLDPEEPVVVMNPVLAAPAGRY